MNTRVLRDVGDISKLSAYIDGLGKYPVVVSVTVGDSFISRQNRLAQMWNADIARHKDQPFEEIRAYNKLTFGIPIRLRDDPAFAASWHRSTLHCSYEEKLTAIQVYDMPVTRLFKKLQMIEYMEAVQRHWITECVALTDPEALKYAEEFR